jgi:PPK2 family polyphosphate:nucleotide phosphotransferase
MIVHPNRERTAMNLAKRLVVDPGERLELKKRDPEDTAGFENKKAAKELLGKNASRLAELQYRLYAENQRSLLVVLQAIDAGGKDGTIRHIFSGFNPQGCSVTSFKAPSAEEADHDYLWRIHKQVPPKGEIGVFNRSHYEDVLVVRVHNLVPRSVWSKRYEQINLFERILAENGVKILKFFLHISKDEQKKRFEKRIADPTKQWKLALGDFEERKRWDDYIEAFEEALSRCSTEYAPWYVIPANKKWFRDVAVSEILLSTMQGMDMKFPEPKIDVSKLKVE